MDSFGAGHQTRDRSLYGRLFNRPLTPDALESQLSLNPVTGSSQTSFAAPNLQRAQEKVFQYEAVDLNDIGNPPTALTSGQSETPKQAIRRGFWPNSFKLVPHIAATAVTVAVVQLSFRDEYWMDLKDPNVEILPGITQGGAMNALQLAAKLHEMILVASLGNIIMHMAHVHLVGNHGLPLGLIANCFAIGSGDYLRTKAFWASVWAGKAHYWRFWLCSLLATVLATLAGPSSAIAVIPSLDWFSIDTPFSTDVLPFYVFNQSTTLWPNTVNADSANSPTSGINCTASLTSTTDQDSCPAGGFGITYPWAGNLLFTNSSAGSNISYPDARGDTRRILSTQSCASDFDGRASGISLNTFITGAMTAYWTFAQNNFEGLAMSTSQPRLSLGVPIYAPKVEVMCNGFDYYNTSDVEGRLPVNFPSFTPSQQLPSQDYILPFSSTLNDTTFDWVPMPAGAENPSIGAAVRVPWIYLLENDTTLRQATEFHACSIYAQWVPVDVFYEPRTSDQVWFNVKSRSIDTCLTLAHESTSDQSVKNITIDIDYADTINQLITFVSGDTPAIIAMLNQATFQDDRITDSIAYAFKSPFVGDAEQAANLTTDDVRHNRATMIATILAGTITDSLARIAGNGLFPYSASMFLTNKTDDGSLVGSFLVSSAHGGEEDPLNATAADAGSWLRIDPVFERYGYGYRWKGSRTAQFGILVLLIHAALAFGHSMFILYKVLIRREGLVSSWTSVVELLTLALNSTPSPRLQDTCAGVAMARTWKQTVSVRETYPGHLEMVVGPEDKARHPRPQVGRLYGHLDITHQAVTEAHSINVD